ncbi:hypothetical protein OAM67_01785 [bacterium]|nr:hypothetical protein [bacterium]
MDNIRSQLHTTAFPVPFPCSMMSKYTHRPLAQCGLLHFDVVVDHHARGFGGKSRQFRTLRFRRRRRNVEPEPLCSVIAATELPETMGGRGQRRQRQRRGRQAQ